MTKIRKKIIISIIIFIIFSTGVAGGYFLFNITGNGGFIPSLNVNGDLNNALTINDLDFSDKWQTLDYNGKKINVVKLGDLLNLAEPLSQNNIIYFIGEDGRASAIYADSQEQIEESYISFNGENGWEVINLAYPINSNIKRINEIVVVMKENKTDFGLNIISPLKNLINITPGQAGLITRKYFEDAGTSSKSGNGNNFESTVFSVRQTFNLNDIFAALNSSELSSAWVESGYLADMDEFQDKIILYGSRGQYMFTDTAGYFELTHNSINYVDPVLDETIENVKGVILDPPAASIMDVYYDTTGLISQDKKVMLIITDGFGYHQYRYAIENGYAPYLSSISPAEMATSVYEPVSNSGLAAMFTGKPGSESGVYTRKTREPQIPTIFGYLLEKGKKARLIEGDIQIIKLETDMELHTDLNSSGTIDDEIMEAALSAISSNEFDFIAVHFHSIDDTGHDYGDISKETMETIREIDSYIKKLASTWTGKIIITSDHGMHATDEGGSHGELRFEDMIVPYIIFDSIPEK